MTFRAVLTVLALIIPLVHGGLVGRTILESSYQPALPRGWTQRELTSEELLVKIELSIALRNQNIDQLKDILRSVSDPNSVKYGEYLTWREVNALISPSKTTVNSVYGWLGDNGITDVELVDTGDYLRVRLSISAAETLLQTKFVALMSRAQDTVQYRSLSSYSIPSSLQQHIDLIVGVYGTVGLIGRGVRIATSVESSDVTPEVIKSMTYSTGVVGKAQNNSISVAEFLNQYYCPSDLQHFQEEYSLLEQPVDVVDGPNDDTEAGIEAQLDIEYLMACGQNISAWFISTPGRHQGQEPFLTWLQDMQSTPDAPWIYSVSFGDREASISLDYANQCDEEFMKFGATGRTIFFASGDDGVGCRGCPSAPVLQPNWPATSEYVTAVGGVALIGSSLQGDSISSGGFSNYYSQPYWQADAVQAYLQANDIPRNEVYNVSNRAVPDIAGFSENVRIVIDNANMGVSGTSCAAPAVAGVFGLINDLRFQKGMPPLGFINPWLYQMAALHGDAFTDVTSGVNSLACCTGFTAAAGWDPVTGWGLPNYATLSKYALEM